MDNTLYLSGMVGLEPHTMELVSGGIEAESRRTMDNLRLMLEAHGASMDDVVKCTVMLADISEWGTFNEIYRTCFNNNRYPARSALGANGLALGARIEVDCIAIISDDWTTALRGRVARQYHVIACPDLPRIQQNNEAPANLSRTMEHREPVPLHHPRQKNDVMASNRISVAILTCLPLLSCSTGFADTTLLWSEEFNEDGAPDSTTWSYDVGDLGVNQELQVYTNHPNNVRVEDGHLVLTARQASNGRFTSGRVKTQDKITFQYGTIEARIRIPDLGNGLWPAFWTLGNNIHKVGWPACGEIDILEMGAQGAINEGVVNRRAYSTVHWDYQGNHASYGGNLTLNEDLDDGFHTWTMHWTPDYIMTFVDGQYAWAIDISNPDAFGGHEFHAPHFLIVNLAVGGHFPGIYNTNGITAPIPAEYRVDYIRLYDNGHTILGGTGLDEACPGDINQDGAVDGADLAQVLADWSTSSVETDLDCNGTVDSADLGLLLAAWGACS